MTEYLAPQPGMVLHLVEEHYKFGVGPVLCRVREVITAVVFDDEPWWHLRGECANGTVANHGGWVDRELYVLASAVHRSATRRERPR